MAVVVPARDEECEIEAALEAVAAAADAVDLPVTVVLVLHECTDATGEVAARVAARHTGARWVLLESRAPTLGRARAEGVERALAASGVAPDEVWVASTDADSRVPGHWLAVQRAAADAGTDLLLGTVEPEEDGSETSRLWRAQHHLVEGHTAIHAANLGVRGSAYLAAGGFPDVAEGEDAGLVHQVRDVQGLPWASTDRTRVTTSARREGRVHGGFARFLRRLDDAVVAYGVTEELEARLRTAILELVAERGPDRTICPSEAAEVVDPERRRALTHVARAVACQMVDEGLVEITQKGIPVDGRTTPGPVRIRLAL